MLTSEHKVAMLLLEGNLEYLTGHELSEKVIMLVYQPTPVQEIRNKVLEEREVRLLIKREDLNHPFIAGNKWWKLKYNMIEAKKLSYKTLLTFGGAFSNHIYAAAAASNECGFKSIGIIRGEETLPLNATLSFAVSKGMNLHFISREQYRKKNELEFIQKLNNEYGDFFLIPEGGSNSLAVKGIEEFAVLLSKIQFDYLCCPAGTGATLAGLIRGTDHSKTVLGFSSLKGNNEVEASVKNFVDHPTSANWKIIDGYHFGGYAKYTSELIDFIKEFEHQNSIPLEHVYTGKMLFGIFDLLIRNFFERGSTILVIHTGGLQGKLKAH